MHQRQVMDMPRVHRAGDINQSPTYMFHSYSPGGAPLRSTDTHAYNILCRAEQQKTRKAPVTWSLLTFQQLLPFSFA